jgi:glycosyltransferase involved in cell wall biosynthesis
MKIFYVGDSPTVDTGFGVVAKNLLPRLQKLGHEIVVLGINEYGDNPRQAKQFDFPIYPCDKGGPEQVYGFHKLWPTIERENPDLLFLLNDPWLIKNYIDMKPPHLGKYLKTVGYYPTDGGPLKPEWLKTLNSLDAQICYSHYAESVVTQSNNGRPENLEMLYHGVDTSVFFPVNQSVARAQLGIPPEDFIVGMVARNQPRKRFDLMMQGFARFAKDKENVRLYLHTGLQDIGFDIVNLQIQLGLENKLILTPGITPNQGVPDDELNMIYNSMDVHALISLGDGFGLPVAESMATGTPQVVSGHSCLQELVEDHGGYIVKNAAWIMNSGGMNTWGGVSDVQDIADKLELLYKNPERRIKMAQEAYNFITQEQFTWDYAAEKLEGIFKKVYNIL